MQPQKLRIVHDLPSQPCCAHLCHYTHKLSCSSGHGFNSSNVVSRFPVNFLLSAQSSVPWMFCSPGSNTCFRPQLTTENESQDITVAWPSFYRRIASFCKNPLGVRLWTFDLPHQKKKYLDESDFILVFMVYCGKQVFKNFRISLTKF